MDNPFETKPQDKEKKKFTTMRIEDELLDKLKLLNKGSPNQAIRHLLTPVDQSVNLKIKKIETDIVELQTVLEKLIQYNKLRV